MKNYYTFIIALLSILILNEKMPAQQIFYEDFELGFANPEWGVYIEDEDTIEVIESNNISPPLLTGGNYAGFLQDIDGTYSGAAIALAGANTLMDYSIEANVYCYVNHPSGSAYTGVVVYADNAIETYIKMVADFDSDSRIRLYNNHLDFGTGEYTFEHDFSVSDIPGGIPTENGWHKMKVEVRTLSVDSTAFWCYFDDQVLLGCPIYDTSVDRMFWGQFGVFSFQQDNDGIPGYYDNIVVNLLVSAVEDNTSDYSIVDFSLAQNYPNPFNPVTNIVFSLPLAADVELVVQDILGQQVASLVNERRSAGNHSVVWNANDSKGMKLSSGIYFYMLKASAIDGNEFKKINKMILLK